MKKLLRLFLISTTSLWLINKWFPQGLILSQNIEDLAKAGFGLMIANSLIKPLFSVIMLPLNLVTFGLFRWVTNVVMLWLVINFVGGIAIHPFKFAGFNYAGIIIPPISFTNLTAWIAIPFFISLTSSFLIWLIKK